MAGHGHSAPRAGGASGRPCRPADEPYHVPEAAIRAIARTRAEGGRVVALGTTVTRALEHAASQPQGLRSGHGLANQRIGAGWALRVVDAILTGVHEPGTSHYELLRAFAADAVLEQASALLSRHGYRTHELGDSVLLMRSRSTRMAEPSAAGGGGRCREKAA